MLRFVRGFNNPLTANESQSVRLGKLGPVKERNWRLCRTKPATRHLQKHVQDQLIYPLCHVGGEADKPS